MRIYACLQTIRGTTSVRKEPRMLPKAIPHHLQFILPELLLSRLIEEREIANMMDKDVS
jgi:hypothetical protein